METLACFYPNKLFLPLFNSGIILDRTQNIMSRFLLLFAVFYGLSLSCFSQSAELEKGNKLLDADKNEEAEKVYREALTKHPETTPLQTQLAFALIQQKKYDDAEEIILSVLKKEPLDMPANWYGGIMYFYREMPRKALPRFEKTLRLLKPEMGQYASACWFIGKCYENLLYTEGITQKETKRMIEVLEFFLKLRPNAAESKEVREFLDKVEANRPPEVQTLWREPDGL